MTLKERLFYAWERVYYTVKKVFLYVLIGVGIGAIIHNWIPEVWVMQSLGNGNPFGVIIATIIGAPMYADIFGCIPIAQALLEKGALLGVVLSFMMAVTTLSLPSIIMLKKVLKTKLLAISMGCNVGCPITDAKIIEDWGLEDPSGKSDAFFKETIRQIEEKILNLKKRLS